MWQRIRIHNPYQPRDASRFTRAASTPRKARQWAHVYESARSAGLPEGRAIAAASSAVKRTNPLLADIVAGDLLGKGYAKAKKAFSSKGRRKNPVAFKSFESAQKYASGRIGHQYIEKIGSHWVVGNRKLKNMRRRRTFLTLESGHRTGGGRQMSDVGYEGFGYTSAHRKSVARHKRKRKKKNPYLAVLGNPSSLSRVEEQLKNLQYKAAGRRFTAAEARREKSLQRRYEKLLRKRRQSNKGGLSMAVRRKMPKRNARGRFIKASSARRRNKAAPKIRYRTRTRNVVRYRTKKANPRRRRRNQFGEVIPVMVASDVLSGPYKKAKRAIFGGGSKKSHRRRRRNLVMAAPRKRRRVSNRSHHHHHHRRRRNISTKSFVPTMGQAKAILWTAGGVFVGGKITGLVYDKVKTSLNLSGTADTIGRLVVGGALTALTWSMNPNFGLGVGLGAFNTITDYIFTYLWGLQSPYTGISGLQDYMRRDYKLESPGWQSIPSANAMAGLGQNPLVKRTM